MGRRLRLRLMDADGGRLTSAVAFRLRDAGIVHRDAFFAKRNARGGRKVTGRIVLVVGANFKADPGPLLLE